MSAEWVFEHGSPAGQEKLAVTPAMRKSGAGGALQRSSPTTTSPDGGRMRGAEVPDEVRKNPCC